MVAYPVPWGQDRGFLGSVLLGLVLLGGESLLRSNELLLHEEVVLDPLELEEV